MIRCSAVGLLILLLLSCGASDRSTKPLNLQSECPTLDDRLGTLTNLLKEGRLNGLKAAISEDMSQDERTRLVDFLFDAINALPEGTFSGLKKVTQATEFKGQINAVGEVIQVLADGGEVTYSALNTLGTVLNDCTGAPLLKTIDTLLAEMAFRNAMAGLLSSDLEDVELLAGVKIDFSKLTERAGFRSVTRNLLVSVTRPDFNPEDLPMPEGDIGMILNSFLMPGDSLASVQLVAECVAITDSENELGGLVFDLLHASTKGTTSDALTLYDGGLLETIDRLVRPLVGLLKSDENARNSLVVVLSALVQVDTARRFFPDLVVLFAEGIIADVVMTLVALATGEC